MKETYTFAGIRTEIEHLYPYFALFARDYLTCGCAELSVSVTEADIRGERARSPGEGFTDGCLETMAVLRRLSTEYVNRGVVLMHASALTLDGEACLFAAPSGTGKSTHARNWRAVFGERVRMVNDDKPFLRVGESVTVYGSPWDGKHRLSSNISAPVKGICFLYRSPVNRIEPISPGEALPLLLGQLYRPESPEGLRLTLELAQRIAERVKLRRLGCNMDPESAIIALEGMKE